MGTPFLGEIKIVSFGFAPRSWAQCNGQLMPINQNQALFSLLGTMYGGNGQTNFALPDLRARVPIHMGGSFTTQGQAGGEAAHTLTQSEMPTHTHLANGSPTNGDQPIAMGNFLATAGNLYNAPGANLVPLFQATVSSVGGSQAHTNMQPMLVLTFCIALQGIFPSRN